MLSYSRAASRSSKMFYARTSRSRRVVRFFEALVPSQKMSRLALSIYCEKLPILDYED